MAQRLCCGLAGEIDLQGAVDSYHLAILGDDQGVVGVVDGPEFYAIVISQKIICRAVAHAEGGDGLSRIDAFIAVVHHPIPYEPGYAIAQ